MWEGYLGGNGSCLRLRIIQNEIIEHQK